jgi:hypothetical protein
MSKLAGTSPVWTRKLPFLTNEGLLPVGFSTTPSGFLYFEATTSAQAEPITDTLRANDASILVNSHGHTIEDGNWR